MIEYSFNKAQSEYLASTDDIVLYGGQAGAGKSLVAIIDMLGLNDPENGPRYQLDHYRAMICRKRRGDLADLIDKSKSIYPLIDSGAVFNNSDCFWTFSSGAKIYFKYFDRFSDAEKFLSGQEMQCIVFEEIQQHERDDIFLFAMSRLRSSKGLKCYLRATCNPGRYPWLKEFFRISDAGESTSFTTEHKLEDGTLITKRIKFIRARLQDNKHISKEYQANLMMLSDEDRKALLGGRWDSYNTTEGAVYQYELNCLFIEGRLKHLSHDSNVPVHTFFDLGISDYCVVLFVQFVHDEIRIIDMIEDCGKSLKDYYIPEIIKRKTTHNYVYAGHWLPHDAGAREKYNGISILDQVRQLIYDVEKLPRMELDAGILLTKTMFSRVIINKDLVLFDRLQNYKRKWNPTLNCWSDTPIHNCIESHAADAFRYISYYKEKKKVIIPARNIYA